MFSSSLHHLWIKFYALNIDIISLLEWNWDQKSVCGVYEGTEGKERGEIWNTTQEYWLSSGSRPDLESIPYYAQTCHQTAQMRKVLEATDFREGLFKALFLLFWTYSGEQSYSWVTGSGFGVAALFFFSALSGSNGHLQSLQMFWDLWQSFFHITAEVMKLSRYVLYIFLVIFEARSWKMLHAHELLLVPVSFQFPQCTYHSVSPSSCLLPPGWLNKLKNN